MSGGILLSNSDVDKESVQNLLFDSRKARLQVAIDRDPKHLDIVQLQGTALVTNAGNGYYASETLFSIKHGLGYKPRVLIYYYYPATNAYSCGRFFYGTGALDDYLFYGVDADRFNIVHIVDDTPLNVGYTSTAPSFGNIRIKYMLFSNPADNYTPIKKRV